MALNYSYRHLFSAHLADDNLVSPFGIMNGYFVEGVSDKNGGSSTRCWHSNLDEEKEKEYGCFVAESDYDDIVNRLPSDPFGMDIQTTFTAITEWLEDLEVNCDGYMWRNDGNTGVNDYGFFDTWDFLWNHGLRLQPFPNTVRSSKRSNLAVSYSSGNLDADVIPFYEKKIPNPVDISSKMKAMEAHICDTPLLQACDIFGAVGSEEESDKSSACLPLPPEEQVEQTSFVEGAFTLALSYLGVRDLLSVERVCKSLFLSARKDPWLWKTIHIDQPLNERITDDILLRLASRAQGRLQCLSLVECPKVTDDGLRLILETNPQLSKLSVPGCTRISIECVVDGIRAFNSRKNVGGITQLRIGGLYGVDHEHFEELKMLLGMDNENSPSASKQYFYHRGNFYLPYDDDRVLDIEICPSCEKYRLVYDCPSQSCNLKDSSQACRACTLCISRCAQCGRCVNDTEFEETFCLELLCSDCFRQLL